MFALSWAVIQATAGWSCGIPSNSGEPAGQQPLTFAGVLLVGFLEKSAPGIIFNLRLLLLFEKNAGTQLAAASWPSPRLGRMRRSLQADSSFQIRPFNDTGKGMV